MNLSKDTFQQFQSFLTEQSGLYIPSDQSKAFGEKLAPRLEKCQLESYENYLHLLKFHPQGRLELQALLDLVTIGETYFFRNEPQFETFRKFVIPRLVEKKMSYVIASEAKQSSSLDRHGLRPRDDRPSLRIWSAGCSTGEEPYTISMILKESLPDFDQWDISIIATDINRNVLKAAEEGVYGSRSVQYVPDYLMARFFSRKGRKDRIKDEIKQMVRFEYHNLATDPYTLPGMLDLDCIFCRNVTIYFDQKTLKRAITQFSDCLVTDGYLFIGHAETLWGISDDFKTIEFPQTFIYQKRVEPLSKTEMFHIPLPSDMGVMSHATRDEEVCHPRAVPALPTGQAGVRQESGDLEDMRGIPASAGMTTYDSSMQQATDLANKGEYQKALDQLKDLVEEDKLCTPAYYLMGVLFTKLERYEDAVREFRRVLYIDEKLAIGYYHLGNLYRFLGRGVQAKKEYINCLKLLKTMENSKPVPLSEGLTAGIMYYAAERAMEGLRSEI